MKLLLLLIVGAVLRFVCPARVGGVNLHGIGDIVMVVGSIPLAILLGSFITAAILVSKS